MKEKNVKWEAFLTAINEEINTTIAIYAGTEKLHTYAWGYRYLDDNIAAFGSTHEETFYHADKVMSLALAFGYSAYLDIKPNEDKKKTPCVVVYKD